MTGEGRPHALRRRSQPGQPFQSTGTIVLLLARSIRVMSHSLPVSTSSSWYPELTLELQTEAAK